ncbi:hypothetical protein PG989_007612 [Apiospora arundinis]
MKPALSGSTPAGAAEFSPNSGVLAVNSPTAAFTVHDDLEASELPQNWSKRRRWLIIIVLSLMSLMVSISLVISTPAASVIADEFNNHDRFLSVFFLTVPNLGQVVSPLYIGPLSERYGRVPVCHLFNLLFIAFTMIGGFSHNFATLIVSRFLSGASIFSICLNPAITGDLFAKHERGTAMSLASMIPILGSAMGPILGGYVTQYLSWRWTCWLVSIGAAALTPVMAVTLQESYLPVIRRRRLKKGNCAVQAAEGSRPRKYWKGWNVESLKSFLLLGLRPFIILGSSRVAVLMTLYLSILFGYVSLLASTLASTFQDVYGFSESQSGLVYIALTVGTLTGVLLCTFTLDYFFVRGFSRKKPVDGETPRPENRLIPILPAMIAFPAGLLIYGWTLEKRAHWMVPAIGSMLCGFSLASSTTPIMSYLVDIFDVRSASAIAAVLPLRYLAGAFLPVASPYMYARLGHGWANTLLALILLVIVPFIFRVIIRPQHAIVPNVVRG